jgi:hypothetical protein
MRSVLVIEKKKGDKILIAIFAYISALPVADLLKFSLLLIHQKTAKIIFLKVKYLDKTM